MPPRLLGRRANCMVGCWTVYNQRWCLFTRKSERTNERTLSLHPGSPPLQSRGHHPTLKRRERERERKKEREGEKRKYVLSHPRVLAVHGLALSSGCLDHQHVQGMPSVLLVAELTLYRGGVSEQVRQYPHQLSKFLRQLRGARRRYLHAPRSHRCLSRPRAQRCEMLAP